LIECSLNGIGGLMDHLFFLQPLVEKSGEMRREPFQLFLGGKKRPEDVPLGADDLFLRLVSIYEVLSRMFHFKLFLFPLFDDFKNNLHHDELAER